MAHTEHMTATAEGSATASRPPTPPTETVSIPLPEVQVQRPAKRGDDYCLTFGRCAGRGSTLAAAKADLARQIGVTCESVSTDPAFARDDDGALITAIDRPWGIDWYRVTDTRARCIASGTREGRTPAGDLAAVHHYTVIPLRP